MSDEVNIKFTVDDSQLKRAQTGMQTLGKEATSAGQTGSHGLMGIVGAVSQIGFGVFGLQQTFMGLKSVIGGLFSSNIQFEQLETQFKVLLGSSDAAKDRMDELAKFAKDTPFELPQVVKASKVLQTFGGTALATGEGLRLVGDVAAGVGVGIDELSMWFGRLYDGLKSGRPVGEAMMRLQELGAVSGATRTRIEELQASGADGEIVWQEFAGSMGKYSGMMAEQSKTVGGALSNISDGFSMMKRNLMAGIFEAAKPGVMAFASWLGSDGVQGAIKETGLVIGEFVNDGIRLLGDGIETVIGPIKTLIGLFKESAVGRWVSDHKELVAQYLLLGPIWATVAQNWDKIKDAAGGAKEVLFEIKDFFAELFDRFDIAGKFDDLKQSMADAFTSPELKQSLDDLKTSITDLGMDDFASAWAKLVDVLQPAIDVLKPLAEDVLKSLKDSLEPISKAFKDDLLPALKELAPVGNVLLPLFEALGKIIGVLIVGQIAIVLVSLKLLVEALAVILVGAIKGTALVIQGFGATIQWLAPIVTSAINSIVPLFQTLLNAGKSAFDGLTSAIQALAPVWDIAVAHFNTGIAILNLGWEMTKTVFTAAWDFIQLYIKTGLDVIRGVFDVFVGLWTGDWERAWDGIKQIVVSIWEGIKGAVDIGLKAISDVVTNWLPGFKELFSAGFEEVKAIWSAVISFAYNAGEMIVKGLWNGVKAIWGGFVADLKGMIDNLPWIVKKALGIDSPSKVMFAIGEWTAQGLADGIVSKREVLYSAVSENARVVTDALVVTLEQWKTVLHQNVEAGASATADDIQAMFANLNTLVQNSGLGDSTAMAMQSMATAMMSGYQQTGSLAVSGLQDMFDKLIAMAKTKSAELAAATKISTGATGGGGPEWNVLPDVPPFMTAAGGARPTYIGGGQYGLMPGSKDDMSSNAPVGWYNPTTNLTWTGTGWIQGDWWKPGDPGVQEMSKQMAASRTTALGGSGAPSVTVNIQNVTATNAQEAEAAGSSIGYSLLTSMRARGLA